MIQFPHSKINLGLNIIEKRSDGFHNIETVLYHVPLTDALEIIHAQDGIFQFQATGLDIPGKTEHNLCIRAFHMLKTDFRLPNVKIYLHKVIPAGSGLGGGSSDGAGTLKMLNELFDLGLGSQQLKQYARRLGSDCAFFIEDHPQFAFQKGDQLEQIEVDLAGKYIVIVIPDVHIVTEVAYGLVVPGKPVLPLKNMLGLPVEDWKDRLVNDFEKPVFEKYPVIGAIKQQLYNSRAIYASLSGSGSAVYGIFKEAPELTVFNQHFHWMTHL